MSCKIIYNERNEKINVEDKNGNPSTIFPQIMSNPHVTSFEQALEIYLNTYNVEQLNTKNNEQTGITELGESRGDRTRWNPSRGSQTLEGAPINTKRKNVTGADPELTFWAEEYARRNGIDYKRQSKYVEVDIDRAMRIAEAYDKMEHAPQDPTVREAYENLIQQTIAQYNILVEAGYQFYFFDETNDPYNGNPMAAMEELRNEKRMGSFATEAGFGTGNEGLDVSDNPMLADTGLEWGFGSIDGQKKRVLANDLFRAVHDAFGHGLEGAGFRARGEENAWQAHARLFTGSAVAAITSETRGQNSWLNFGKYGEQNRNAKVEDTIFAPQKTGLMPEWTWKEGFDEGVSNNEDSSFSQKEPNLLYKANDKVFKTFSEALKSGAQTIEGGLNTTQGFKTFFSVDSNSNLNTLNGRINHLIKQNILTGESYISKKGEKVYKTVGHNAVRKMFSATTIDGFVKSILANGDVILRKLKNPAQIELKTKKGETEIVNRKDLDKMTFQEMQSKFEEPLTILANVELQKAQSGKREIEQTQILPENELQERLLNLLQKFGIPTMAIEEYQKRYEIKNGQLPNASALTDLANLVVAFKDGVIQMEDLTEEVAHLIVASMPQEQKENLLRNIHRTREWKQYSEQYREVYNDDAQLREEILGKVLANSLQERFAQRESETENTILEKLLEAIQNFFNRVAAYFRPQYQVELDQYTENVYDNLMADALELDTVRIKETGHTLFSLGETTSKALNLLKAQESKIRNRATREKLSKTEEELRNIQDDEIELEKTAITLGEIAKKQATFLKRAFDKNTKKGTLFTQEENAVFNTFKAQTRPTLEALRELLKKKNLAPEAVKTINEALATISELSGKISNHDSNVIDNIIDRMVERHSLSERQKKELKTILSATQKDTTTLHTYLGSLIHARNPLLNMAGSVIGDMTMNANIGYLDKIKALTQVLEQQGVNPSRLRELIRGNYLISEINYEEKENAEKDARRRAYNEVKNTQLTQEQFDALKDLELNPQESKQYREAYERISLAEFAEDMYVASHRQKLETIYQGISDEARQFHENDRRDRAEIRRRATDENGLVIYDENDAAEIEQLNKVRTQMMNPRDESGKLYAGLDEDSDGRLFQLPNTKLSPDAKMALDLHKIQEAMSGLYDQPLDNQEFPPKFLEELNKLNTAEEKADFLFLNAYVGFPQDFWESTEQSLMDKLEENGQEDLIKEIRGQQQIVSYILKANRMFNQPSQINVDGMSNKEKEAIKDATEKLQDLYNKASKALNDKTVRVPNAEKETVTNEAFDADAQDLLGTVIPLLEFISNHSTTKGKQSLRKLMSLYEGLSNGTITTLPEKYEGIIDLDNLETSVTNYAKTKLLPYYKRTEPTGFTTLVNKFKNGTITAEEFIASPLVEVKPNFSFYESVQSSHINPKWLENKKNNRPQVKDGVFADKEYISYFGIQNGQPTRNLDMWEARKAMLEIAKSSLADYGEDGRNIYMLPQVGKRGLRQAVDTIQDFSKRSWKESIRDLVQFREDEKEFGENGLRSPIIPKYYISKLTDQKDVTDDLLYSYALLAQQSSLYKARTEAFTEMFAIEEALKQQKFENKEATATNAYKMFQSYMDYNIFGKKENFQYNVEIAGMRFDLAKVARGFQSMVRTINLTGVVVPLTSGLQGSIVKRMESIIGERLNPIAEREGNALYVKYAPGAAGEILGINSKNYLNVLMEYFGMSDVAENRYQNSIYGKSVRGLTKWSSFTHDMSNFTINPRVMFSVLADNRYYGSAIYTFKQFQTLMKAQNKSDSEITAEWKALPSLHEDIEAKDGRIVFNRASIEQKLGVGKEEYFDNYMKGVASRIKITLQEIDTQIPQEEKSIAARHGIANFFMLHRNWLWVASQKRFKSRQINLATGLNEEGSWSTVGRIFKEFLGKRPDQVKFLEHIKNVYQGRNFDTTGMTQAEIEQTTAENLELQRRNLKRVLVDMVFANLLLTGSYLLSQYVDDDEDPTAALLFLDYMTYRVANEQISGTVALPRQYVDLIDSPIAAINRLYDTADILDVFSSEVMESGTFAGETKSARWLYRNLPAVKEYHRLANIQDATKTYKFFNKKNEPWTLATYYLLKEE